MASDNKDIRRDEFDQVDPLHESVVGTIGATSEFIQESTAIPESGFVDIPESRADGPQIVGDGDATDASDGIPESQATTDEASELPGKDKKGQGASALKKNLPFIALGGVAVVLAGGMAMKMMSSGGTQQPKPVQQQVTAMPQPKPAAAPVVKVAPSVPSAPSAPSAASSAMAAASAPSIPAIKTPDALAQAASAVASVAMAPASAPTPASVVAVAPAPTPATAPAPAPVAPRFTPVSKPMAAGAAGVADVPVMPAVGAAGQGVKNNVAAAGEDCACAAQGSAGGQKKPLAAGKPAAKASGAGGHIKFAKAPKPKKAPEPLPSTVGYQVYMGANGLAWVVTPDDERIIVTVGDKIPGLGVVKAIDTKAHQIRVGRVTLR